MRHNNFDKRGIITYTSEAGGVPQRGGHVRGEQRAGGGGARQRVRALVRGAAAARAVLADRWG